MYLDKILATPLAKMLSFLVKQMIEMMILDACRNVLKCIYFVMFYCVIRP